MRISHLLGWTAALAIALGAGTNLTRGQDPDEAIEGRAQIE